MKNVIFLLLLSTTFLFSASGFAQTTSGPLASVTFNWVPPSPKFMGVVPPHWDIQKYELACVYDAASVGTINPYVREILGYDTATATFDDVPLGQVICAMRSWSDQSGQWSDASDAVTDFIYNTVKPNSPHSMGMVINLTPPDGSGN